MKSRRFQGRSEIEKFFEYARRRDDRPALKPLNYTFEPARRPDLMMPQRPRTDIRAADTALREIHEYATKARQMYRERRHNERPIEAREYVRHQLALGMLDAPTRRGTKVANPMIGSADPASEEERRERATFRFWRRRRPNH